MIPQTEALFVAAAVISCVLVAESAQPSPAKLVGSPELVSGSGSKLKLARTSDLTYSLVISAPLTRVRSGAIVRLDITVANTTEQVILFDMVPGCGYAESDFDIQVASIDGVQPGYTEYGRKIHDSSLIKDGSKITLDLKPGEGLVKYTDLSTIYKFSKVGTYNIRAARLNPLTNLLVKSNIVTLTVIK